MMEPKDFVSLARHAFAAHYDADTAKYKGRYDDDTVSIDACLVVNRDMLLEVTRKRLKPCPEGKEHFSVSNPTTMVYPPRENEGPGERIIRHHGEHTYIVNHLMWLASQSEDRDTLAFLAEMEEKYPHHKPREGMDLETG